MHCERARNKAPTARIARSVPARRRVTREPSPGVGNTLGKFFGMVYYMSVMSGVSNGRAVTTGRLAARFALGDL